MNALIKILMVEDSATDAELILRELERDGLAIESHRVETAESYSTALDKFQPDVILSDFSLPQFDGLSALTEAHRRYPDVPFIFVSGTIDEDTAVAALRGGATDFIIKTHPKRLAAAIRRALGEVGLRSARLRAETHFRDLIEFAPSAIIVINEKGLLEIVNLRTESLFGYQRTELLGQPSDMLVTNDFKAFLDGVAKNDISQLEMKSSSTFEAIARRKNGSESPAEITLSPLLMETGMWMSGVIRNITKRREQELRIARLNRIQTVLSNINAAGIRSRERDTLCRDVCDIAVRDGQFKLAWIGFLIPGTQQGEAIAWAGAHEDYMPHVTLNCDPHSPQGQLPAARALRDRTAVMCNDIEADPAMVPMRREATQCGFRSVVALPLIVEDAAVGVIVLFAADADFFNDDEMVLLNQLAADMSFALAHQANQSRLAYMAYFDALTDLPNRTLFVERLQKQLLHPPAAEPRQLAVVMMDIDRFRNFNDTLGRDAGNVLLQKIAERLSGTTLAGSSVARVESNCFAFLVRSDLEGDLLIADIERQLALDMDKPVLVSEKDVRVSFRTGTALFPLHGTDAETLLRNAEAALLNAKQMKVPHQLYNVGMNARMAEKHSLETRLRHALEQDQFVLHYQPKIELASGRMTGLEALIRWMDPINGLITPTHFIPVLEETGLIIEVGAWVIREAYRQHQEWSAAGLAPPRIAVNVSQLQIRQKNFVSQVIKTLNCNVSDALELEITESLFMEDLSENIEKLALLRKAGLTIAIDDFGTGYSSLSYIARLPIDVLKIDRSFITDMGSSANHMALVSTIISLAHGLQLKVVAEGVETIEQSHLLKLLRCDQIQGFLHSRPLSAGQMTDLMGMHIESWAVSVSPW